MVNDDSAVESRLVDSPARRGDFTGVVFDTDDLQVTLTGQFVRQPSPAAIQHEAVAFRDSRLFDDGLSGLGVSFR